MVVGSLSHHILFHRELYSGIFILPTMSRCKAETEEEVTEAEKETEV